MSRFTTWLDDRTGYRKLLAEALFERIPGGARWRYVWGSTLMFALGVQFLTGIVLWSAYSANAQGAWESVHYIQTTMAGGWILRGIHHYMAQVTTVLLVLHLMQVVIDGAYKAPREVNFWFGLVLLFLVLGLSLTGYLLPWDQKGYWATKVATSIAAMSPVIGMALQKVLVGGAEYGHHTLTRFFALHAGVLPALIVLATVGHIYLFRRHGVTVKQPVTRPDGGFWPDQVLRDAVACSAVMLTVLFLVFWTGGAPLGAPADPAEAYAAARPEWSFLFLFQWLKYFPAGWEVVGAMIIPSIVVAMVAAMPIIGRWRLGHRFNLGLMGALLVGVGALTLQAIRDDYASAEFRSAKLEAERAAERVQELALRPEGIPVQGAVHLLRQDPLTQGPELFANNCSSCHRFDGHDGKGEIPTDPQSAADLSGFASREWIAGLLDPDQIGEVHYLGGTAFSRGRMVRFVTRRLPSYEDSVRAQIPKLVKALSAEAGLPYQAVLDAVDASEIDEGRRWLISDEMGCLECHDFQGSTPDPIGPSLTGYGSRTWLRDLIANPSHERFYGERNDRMPAYGDEGILTPAGIEMIADWLRQDWYVPRTTSPTRQMVDDGMF